MPSLLFPPTKADTYLSPYSVTVFSFFWFINPSTRPHARTHTHTHTHTHIYITHAHTDAHTHTHTSWGEGGGGGLWAGGGGGGGGEVYGLVSGGPGSGQRTGLSSTYSIGEKYPLSSTRPSSLLLLSPLLCTLGVLSSHPSLCRACVFGIVIPLPWGFPWLAPGQVQAAVGLKMFE